jgi:hypothetical protein
MTNALAVRASWLLVAVLAACGDASQQDDASPGATVAEPGDATADAYARSPDDADAARATDAAYATDAPSAPDAVRPPPPPFPKIPWTAIGQGVAFKDSHNPDGDGVFIGYAGYAVTDAEVRAWVTALYEASLHAHRVRYVYAARGPTDFTYAARDVDNAGLIAHMLPEASASKQPIVVAAHSAGGFVSCELFQLLYRDGHDPKGVTKDRIVYYNLDGIESCMTDAEVAALKRAYFIRARDGAGYSLDANSMARGAARWPSAGGLLTYDAAKTGCDSSSVYCLHISLITTRPHDPTTAVRDADYSDFVGRPVNHWYVDATHAAIDAPRGNGP